MLMSSRGCHYRSRGKEKTMSDKEWLEQIKSVSDEELMEHLEWCGHDNYYNDLYESIIKEIKRRLRSRR